MKTVVNGTTTHYIGNYYEVVNPGVSQVVRKYYYAGGTRVAMRDGGTLRYFVTDHLGSTTKLINTDGSEYSDMEYLSWGSDRLTPPDIGTSFKYTGQRDPKGAQSESEAGLYFYNARWRGAAWQRSVPGATRRGFDPELGRFIQADTIIPQPSNPLAWDRFSYTLNNPINFTDPSGHKICGEYCDYQEKLPKPPKSIVNPPNPPQPGVEGVGDTNIWEKIGLALGNISNFVGAGVGWSNSTELFSITNPANFMFQGSLSGGLITSLSSETTTPLNIMYIYPSLTPNGASLDYDSAYLEANNDSVTFGYRLPALISINNQSNGYKQYYSNEFTWSNIDGSYLDQQITLTTNIVDNVAINGGLNTESTFGYYLSISNNRILGDVSLIAAAIPGISEMALMLIRNGSLQFQYP